MSMKVINPTEITDAMLVSSNIAENDYSAWSSTTIYAEGDRVIRTTGVHMIYEALEGATATVTMTIASPCVVSWTAHGLAAGTAIQFSTTGALPTGLVAGTTYYVLSPLTDSFNVAATVGGAAINTTGSQSGVHTAKAGTNLNKTPEDNTGGTTPHWLEVSPTNRWSMFDQQVNTQSSIASPLEVTIAPGVVNALALLEMEGAAEATVEMDDGSGNIVYSETIGLDSTVLEDWYDYFFEPFDFRSTLVLTDLPAYLTGEITVTLTGSATVYLGGLVVGMAYELGDVPHGVTANINDYSRKTINDFGITSLTPRSYSKRASFKLVTQKQSINRVHKLLTSLRATPCVWIGSEAAAYSESLIIFGFYRDFSLDIAYDTHSYYSLEIEGMI